MMEAGNTTVEGRREMDVEHSAVPGKGHNHDIELLDMIWPETGLSTTLHIPNRPKDMLGADDECRLQIDFLTMSLSPLELIQLAAFLRMSIDGLLDQHPSLQRAVVEAFDIRE
jgi:hypothetical protein